MVLLGPASAPGWPSSCKLFEDESPVFFDPQRKRWKRLRRILDAVAVFSTVILVLFFLGVVKKQQLPELLLPTPQRNYRAIQEQAADFKAKYLRPARRKTSRKPSEVPSIPAKACAPHITWMMMPPALPR